MNIFKYQYFILPGEKKIPEHEKVIRSKTADFCPQYFPIQEPVTPVVKLYTCCQTHYYFLHVKILARENRCNLNFRLSFLIYGCKTLRSHSTNLFCSFSVQLVFIYNFCFLLKFLNRNTHIRRPFRKFYNHRKSLFRFQILTT